MKKLVISMILLIVILAGFWYWVRPVKDAVSIVEKVCSDDVNDLVSLVKAVQGDEKFCNKLEGDLYAYCLAFFGRDVCSSRPEAGRKSCFAVLNKNVGECDDEICHGILGNVEGCADVACFALANRDVSGLDVDEICAPVVARAVRDAECFKQARTPEEADACFNQSRVV